MRVKTTLKLCTASAIAGAAVAPATLRRAKREADEAARKTARGYIRLRERARRVADATGRPGQYTAIAAAVTAQAAKDVANRWRTLVKDVEIEEAVGKPVEAQSAEPPTTIADYMGSRG